MYDSTLTVKGKKTGKIKTFFKGLKCNRLDRAVVARIEECDPNERNQSVESLNRLYEFKTCIYNDKCVQTSSEEHTSSVATQTASSSKPRVPKLNFEYFKKVVENNAELHKKDILIETRRLFLTRVVRIISLKLSSHFVWFLAKSELRPLKRTLCLNFVATLSRIVQHRLSTLIRDFAKLVHCRTLPSLPYKPPEKAPVPKSNLRQSCLYFCKVIDSFATTRKFSCLNKLGNNIRYTYRSVIYTPIHNVVKPLDFFLAPI